MTETELKTLKEHSIYVAKYFDGQVVAIKDLKEEAIRDIKKLLKITEGSFYQLPIKFTSFHVSPSGNFGEVFSIIDYIKWKFNITKEDLKGSESSPNTTGEQDG